MPRNARLAIALALLAVAAGLVIFVVMAFVGTTPPTVSFTTGHRSGQAVQLVLQTDGAVGTGAHPTWVSYQVRTPRTHQWVHTTLWQLPAHTKIDVTIYQYDSGSPLRNQQWGRITDTTTGAATITTSSVQVVNSYKRPVGHTFSVPSLGINVPLPGVKTTEKGFCTAGPCSTKQLHHTVRFSFTTPGSGEYHWQCFIPCGAGHYAGNGGPMQTIGYMGGFLKVVA